MGFYQPNSKKRKSNYLIKEKLLDLIKGLGIDLLSYIISLNKLVTDPSEKGSKERERVRVALLKGLSTD